MELGKDIKLIIFDFDGTLHELKLDWQQARKVLGIENSTASIGDTIEHLKQEGHVALLDSLDDLEAQALTGDVLQEDIKDTLQQLHKRYNIAIYSRNSRKVIADFIKRNDVQVDYIVGREDVSKLKPHPEGLKKILTHFSCTPKEALLVGDTWHDLFVAQEVGLTAIIVGSNYKHISEKPKYRIRTVSELNEVLNNW